MRWVTTVAAFSLVLASTAFGQRGKIGVGDDAPGLDVGEWVESEAVVIEPTKVYVVEFWQAVSATPPDTSRLERLHEAYGHQGLIIVAIAPDGGERLQEFARQQGKDLPYHLGADKRSSTSRQWVRAAGVRDVPAAFVVAKGRIMYIGRTSDAAFTGIVEKVLTGRYDPKLEEDAAPMLRIARRARHAKNWRMALKQYDDVIALDPRVFAGVALERAKMLVVDMDDREAGHEYMTEQLIGKLFREDPGALLMLADKIISDPDIQVTERDLEIAMQAAQAALKLKGRRDAETLAAVAAIHFRRGEYRQAVDLQTQAYFAARPEAKAEHKRVLASYRDASRARAGSSPK